MVEEAGRESEEKEEGRRKEKWKRGEKKGREKREGRNDRSRWVHLTDKNSKLKGTISLPSDLWASELRGEGVFCSEKALILVRGDSLLLVLGFTTSVKNDTRSPTGQVEGEYGLHTQPLSLHQWVTLHKTERMRIQVHPL